jgi:multidrug efflux pump subunit AcrA (membrane-fusion protein)
VGAAQPGVSVPANALVYGENEAWVYLRDKPDHFTRVPVDTAKATPDGYFVSGGLHAGDPVVTGGAGLLMARELNPSTEAGD